MYALLANGPMANRQTAVDDPPPVIVNIEAAWPDDFDSQPPVRPGRASAGVRLVTHPYRFIGIDQIPSQRAPQGFREFAIYSYAPDLAESIIR